MSQRAHVGVLGGGSWGTAVAHLLRSNGTQTLMWLRDPEIARAISETHENPRYLPGQALADGIETTTDLADVAQRCRLIFVVVPTKVLRHVVRQLGEHLLADHLLVSCSKGLEPHSAKRMTEIMREETCVLRVGALSGPNLAKEILRGDPSATVVASAYEEVVLESARALMGPRFRVYGNDDVLGVELGGALKNVAAIASGVAAGLGFGDNTRSLLVTRALAEIRRLGEKLGAKSTTFMGMAGIGDLMVTCASPLSRNHQVGRRLAAGQRLDQIGAEMKQVAEGVNTAAVVHELSERLGVHMPIGQAVYELAHLGHSPAAVVANLMAVQASWEVDRPLHI